MRSHKQTDSLDQGWAWIVLIGSYLTFVALGISWGTFSLLYIEFIESFGQSKGEMGLLFSTTILSECVGSFLCSGFIKLYGCRTVAITGCLLSGLGHFICSFINEVFLLHFTYGVLGGMGRSAVSLSAAVIVQQWFEKKRAFASGFSLMGFSTGNFISPPLLHFLLDHYGWRGTEIIHSGILLQTVICVCMFRKAPNRTEEYLEKARLTEKNKIYTPSKDVQKQFDQENPQCKKLLQIENELKDSTVIKTIHPKSNLRTICMEMWDFSVLRQPIFVLFSFAVFFKEFGFVTFMGHSPSMGLSIGLERHHAILLPTIASISNTVFRLIVSFVSNLKQMNRTIMYAFGNTLAGVTLCFFTLVRSFYGAAALSAIYGLFHTVQMTIVFTVIADLFGLEVIARTSGLVIVFQSVGGIIATPLAGVLYDISSNYNIPFFVCGILQVLGGLFVWIIVFVIERKNRKIQKQKKKELEEENPYYCIFQ